MDFEPDFEDNGFGGGEEDFGPEAAADLFGADEAAVEKFLGDVQTTNATSSALEETDFELPPVTVVNLIASVNLSCEIDLRLVTISTRNIEYNPRRINAAVIRLHRPRCTSMLFGNGRLTILGCRDAETAKLAGKITAKIVKRAGHPDVRFRDFKVETLVCSAMCGFPVRLENLAKDHSRYCNFEPEIFCGVVYRHHPQHGKKATVLVFVSGKLIINGCSKVEDAQEVYKNIYAVLYQYRQ